MHASLKDWTLRKLARAGLLAGGLALTPAAAAFALEPPPPPAAGAEGEDVPPGPAPMAGHTGACATDCVGNDCVGNGCAGNGCDDGCDLGEPWSLSDEILGDSDLTIGGWTSVGYHSRSLGGLMFNNNSNDINLHQQWLYAEKVADGECGLDWGFRFDVMYGLDGENTQAFGNPPGTWDFMNGFDHGIYHWALPQLYLELASGDWSVKAGHFFTPAGYEVVGAPGNFFYSHAYTHVYNEPFTHTGALVTYSAGEDTTIYAGWTAGWDTGFEDFNDGDNSDGSNFIGGFSIGLADDVTFAYITTVGDLGVRGEGYTQHIVVTADVTDKWQYVLSSDLVETNLGGDHQISAANYLFYTVNDCVKTGVRAEWWKTGGESIYEVTAGVNIRPHANLVFRPEVRTQWSDNTAFAEQTLGLPMGDTVFGIDAVLAY
ncbi:MAG: porin [Planctomycetes bacterium]|nr:porin [Planctomycetota bacterium]